MTSDQQGLYVVEQFGPFLLDDEHRVRKSMPGNGSGRIATTPDESVAFVSEASNDIVRVIDLDRFVATGTLAVGRMPGDLCVSPDGRQLYVANAGDISVIDL